MTTPKQIAEQVVTEALLRTVGYLEAGDRLIFLNAIDEALRQRDERAAKIAESASIDHRYSGHWRLGFEQAQETIAAAIRRDDQQEGSDQ